MCCVLNDMGEDSKSVCGLVKAKARVAFEPFRLDDCGEMPDLDESKQILRDHRQECATRSDFQTVR
jgi:hypothetical protein